MFSSSVNRRGRGRALYEEIKAYVVDGTYAAGTPLPSTRACAAEKGLSRTTVSVVYEQLAAEGYIETRPGSPSRVAQGAMAPRARSTSRRPSHMPSETGDARVRLSAVGERVSRLALPTAEVPPSAGVIDFVYGPLAGGDFPTLPWLKASRRTERERPARLAYVDPRGDLSLRHALKAYLARAKGLSCDVEQLVIVNGSQQAIDLCARLLVDPGDRVVVENPGYRMAHHVFEAAGATLHPVEVDQQGLRTDELEKVSDARMVYVTPTHHFPSLQRSNSLTGTLPAPRNEHSQSFLKAACTSGTYVASAEYSTPGRARCSRRCSGTWQIESQ